MNRKPLIVGLGGTLRVGSSTERAIELCLAEARRAGAETEFVKGSDLVLPPYNPEDPHRSPEAKRVVDLMRRCDGLVIGSPGYHGSISGLVKNAIDYCEDLREDSRVYLDGRAVGCVACGAGAQGTASTLATLRSVVHALRGWPTPLGVGVNTTQTFFEANGCCSDENVELQLRTVGIQVVAFAEAFGRSALKTGSRMAALVSLGVS